MESPSLTTPLNLAIGAAVFVFLVLYRTRRSGQISIVHIAGPENPSFLIGNLGELMRDEAGAADLKWQSRFGGVVRFKAVLGVNRLLISDPKAIRHTMGSSRWDKAPESRARVFFLAGPSLSYVNGEDHKRYRRIMNPAFGTPAAKALVPVFASIAASLTNKWKDLLSTSKDESEVLNIFAWMSRATLDAIGHAGCGYDLGALENTDNRLAAAYNNLFTDLFGSPTDATFIMEAALSLLSPPTITSLLEKMSAWSPRLARARNMREVSKGVARKLVEEKSREFANGQGDHLKDVLSLAVKANMSETAKFKLTDAEMFAQMTHSFVAGRETTANIISWILFEMSRLPDSQDKLRHEIYKKERQIAAEGRTSFTAEDLDSLVYLNAVIKEGVRCYPTVLRIIKVATADDVIPLAQSIKTSSGKELTEIPVSKGQTVILSVPGYNRNPLVFGEDAHLFRPERWLEEGFEKKNVSIGVYANLLTFSGGTRSCIGWRFAVTEIQVIIAELISNFEFSLTPQCDRIRRENCGGGMTPTLEGELEKGPQCPLRIRCATKHSQD